MEEDVAVAMDDPGIQPRRGRSATVKRRQPSFVVVGSHENCERMRQVIIHQVSDKFRVAEMLLVDDTVGGSDEVALMLLKSHCQAALDSYSLSTVVATQKCKQRLVVDDNVLQYNYCWIAVARMSQYGHVRVEYACTAKHQCAEVVDLQATLERMLGQKINVGR